MEWRAHFPFPKPSASLPAKASQAHLVVMRGQDGGGEGDRDDATAADCVEKIVAHLACFEFELKPIFQSWFLILC